MALQAQAQWHNNKNYDSDDENWCDLQNDTIAEKLSFLIFVGACVASHSWRLVAFMYTSGKTAVSSIKIKLFSMFICEY